MANETSFDASRAWSSLTVVIVGTFLAAISATTISVALPTIMNVFGASLSSVQWITTAYAMAMAIVIPLAPYLSRVFSSERVYLIALVIFITFSILCAFSWDLNVMLLFRVMQAVGGGLMQPIGMGMVIALFPPHKRGVAFGVFGIAAMAAPAFGPTLGGYIVQVFDWRYIFFLNLPIGLIAIALALKFFQFGKRIPFPKFDISGFISATLASGLLLYLIGKNKEIDWNNPHYVYMLIIGVGALVFFIVNELYSESPLLDLRILKNWNFSLSLVLTVIQVLMMMSASYVLPIFLQNFKGLSAMHSGQVLLPSTLVMALLMPVAGKISDVAGEMGTKVIIAFGIVLAGVATFFLATRMNINASITSIILIASIRNIGLGISMMPARTLGLTEITPKDSQKATAMSSFIMQFSSSLSVAFITLMISNRLNANYAYATSQITVSNIPFNEAVKNLTADFVSKGMAATDAASQAAATILKALYINNYCLAIEHTVFVTALIGTAFVLVVPFFKTKKKVSPVKELKA
ncbi:MAG: DHA2 family efflux MFS transporter permease subunit [Firmicutes bacterium]|nr:DHA2 family efflux MFS transporter permease subunit [Bacillota bacterium]